MTRPDPRILPGGDPTVALVLLHPRGATRDYMLEHVPLLRLPPGQRPTIICPQGVSGWLGSTSWHAGPGVSGYAAFVKEDDFGYLTKLVSGYRYVAWCGFSGGAYMAQTMAAIRGEHAITFAGTLAADFREVTGRDGNDVNPRASCDNFVGSGEQYAPYEGKVRIGGWMNRQPSYQEQVARWPSHLSWVFSGGHEIPREYDGNPIEKLVLGLFREEFLRRTNG